MKSATTALTVMALGAMAQAATVPYTESFSQTGTPADNQAVAWVEATDAQWSLASGKYIVDATASGSGLAPSSSVNVGAGLSSRSFTMTSDFTLQNAVSNSISGGTTRVGFGAYGASNTFSSTYYLVDFIVARGTGGTGATLGSLRMQEIGGDEGGDKVSTATPLGINFTDTYRLTLVGTPSGASGIGLTLTATNLTTLGSVSVNYTYSTALKGQNFGYRTTVNGTSGSKLKASFDSFSIVPEPATAGLLAVGGLALMATRRRRPR